MSQDHAGLESNAKLTPLSESATCKENTTEYKTPHMMCMGFEAEECASHKILDHIEKGLTVEQHEAKYD
jgi:hypothetical protein